MSLSADDMRKCPACGTLCDGDVCSQACARHMDAEKAEQDRERFETWPWKRTSGWVKWCHRCLLVRKAARLRASTGELIEVCEDCGQVLTKHAAPAEAE